MQLDMRPDVVYIAREALGLRTAPAPQASSPHLVMDLASICMVLARFAVSRSGSAMVLADENAEVLGAARVRAAIDLAHVTTTAGRSHIRQRLPRSSRGLPPLLHSAQHHPVSRQFWPTRQSLLITLAPLPLATAHLQVSCHCQSE